MDTVARVLNADTLVCAAGGSGSTVAAWVTVVTADLAALAALISAGVAVKQREISRKMLEIAHYQRKTSELTLKANLFEKRWGVYDTLIQYIRNNTSARLIPEEGPIGLLRDTAHSKFLFGQEVVDLITEVEKCSNQIIKLKALGNDAAKLDDLWSRLESYIEKAVAIFTLYLKFPQDQ
jgi:hypothetical protein